MEILNHTTHNGNNKTNVLSNLSKEEVCLKHVQIKRKNKIVVIFIRILVEYSKNIANKTITLLSLLFVSNF